MTIQAFVDEFREVEKGGVYKELFFSTEDYANSKDGSIQHLPSFAEQNFYFSHDYAARLTAFYVSGERSVRQIFLTCSGICKMSFTNVSLSDGCVEPSFSSFKVRNKPYDSVELYDEINFKSRTRYCVTVYHEGKANQENWLFVGEKIDDIIAPIKTYVTPHIFDMKKTLARFYRDVPDLQNLQSSPNFPNSPDAITTPLKFEIEALPHLLYNNSQSDNLGIYIVGKLRVQEFSSIRLKINSPAEVTNCALKIDSQIKRLSANKTVTHTFGIQYVAEIELTVVGKNSDIAKLDLIDEDHRASLGSEKTVKIGLITEKNLSISYIDSRPAALYIAKQQPTAKGFNETVYVFYREYGSSGSYMSRVLPDDGIIDLKGLTRYSVFLRATNYYRHYDQFSHISDHETLEGVPAVGPENVTVKVINNQQVRITWNPINSTYWNGILTKYVVRFGIKDTPEPFTYEINPEATEFTIDDLMSGKTYEFKLAGGTSAGLGVFTDTFTVALAGKPTKPPTLIHACFKSASEVSMKIGEIPENDRNGIILSYQVNISKPNRESELAFNIPLASRVKLQYSRSFDPAVTTYNVRMAGVNKDGSGVIGNYTFQNRLCRKASRRYISNPYFNNKRLMNHVIQVENGAFDAVQCMLTFCEDDARCESVNYNKETKVCELNDMIYTDHSQNFVDSAGWKFYQVMGS